MKKYQILLFIILCCALRSIAQEPVPSSKGTIAPSAATIDPSRSETWYYYFFSRPWTDRSTPGNRTVRYTEIREITGTQAELSKMAQPVFDRINNECENQTTCTSDFNIYKTLEEAKAALRGYLKPYAGNPSYTVKVFVP